MTRQPGRAEATRCKISAVPSELPSSTRSTSAFPGSWPRAAESSSSKLSTPLASLKKGMTTVKAKELEATACSVGGGEKEESGTDEHIGQEHSNSSRMTDAHAKDD